MELVIICKNWDFLFENKISVAQILMMGVTHKQQLALAFFLADAQCFSVSVLTCESLHMCLQMTSTGEDIFALVASLGLLITIKEVLFCNAHRVVSAEGQRGGNTMARGN